MPKVEDLQSLANTNGLDAFVLMPGPNLRFATGLSFHLSERPVVLFVPAQGPSAIVLPALEADRVAHSEVGLVSYPYTDEEGPRGALQSACAALELADAVLGVEAQRMRLMEARLVERYAPGCQLLPAEEILAEVRMCKTGEELSLMRRAAAITETGLTAAVQQLRAGMTEKQAAGILTLELLRAGGEDLAFSPTVLAGPSAAQPHASPGDRKMRAGETVVVDCGVSMGGYAADITRTFVFGKLDPDLAWVYEVVLMANAAATAAVRPGTPIEVVDQTARAVIEEAGYGQWFTHRTGHGLGLETHEPPYVVAGNRLPLARGMTFTIEPGIYLPGRGGVRIEDDVVVTRDGVEVLTSFPRKLQQL